MVERNGRLPMPHDALHRFHVRTAFIEQSGQPAAESVPSIPGNFAGLENVFHGAPIEIIELQRLAFFAGEHGARSFPHWRKHGRKFGDDGNRRFTGPRFGIVYERSPHRTRNVQLSVSVIFPPKPPNFRFAKSSECGQGHNGTRRLRQDAKHTLYQLRGLARNRQAFDDVVKQSNAGDQQGAFRVLGILEGQFREAAAAQ